MKRRRVGCRPTTASSPTTPFRLQRDGVRLAGTDFGGSGRPLLLLHGLAGHAREWARTAAWLAEDWHVVALDGRGHGASERTPPDVSTRAQVADVAYAVEALDLAPVVLVGQSLGAITALLTAAAHPELVRALVVVEAGVEGTADEAAAADLGASLRSWPVPFASPDAARAFFSTRSPDPDAWVGGLEHRPGGWWPAFDVDTMVRTLREADSRSYWDEWERIECPTLVVRGARGSISAEHAVEMVARARGARAVEIPGAPHDVHLHDSPAWRAGLKAFLDGV